MRIFHLALPLALCFPLLAMAAGITSETLTVKGLSSTYKIADFPVCFNGAGELLPCGTAVDPVPDTNPYNGFWSGMMNYNQDYGLGSDCSDSEVLLRIIGEDDWYEIVSVVLRRATTGVDISEAWGSLKDGYAVGSVYAYGARVDYTLQFNRHGGATGEWAEENTGCYGSILLSKD